MLVFENNIKDVMGWNDKKYELFEINWGKAHEIHILSQRSAFIYSKDYFEFLLSTFFTICQIDLDLKTKVVDKKVVLLTLVCFYLVNDTSLNRQTPTSIKTLSYFLNELVGLGLITKESALKTTILLGCFIQAEEDIASDYVSQVDIRLVSDLLNSSNPIIVSKNHAMFYYDNPQKATFLVKKPYPTPVDFFDGMFEVSRTISDSFLKTLYLERLSRLMETQNKKSIFPF